MREEKNRTVGGVRAALAGLLAAGAGMDLLWAAVFYPHGDYVNRGLGGVYLLALWVPVLLVTAFVVTVRRR